MQTIGSALVLSQVLFELFLGTQQLSICILDESHDVALAEPRYDMLIYALLLKPVKLEEVGEPEHVLHQVYVFAFLLFVSAGPEHLVGVHEVEHDSEGLRR